MNLISVPFQGQLLVMSPGDGRRLAKRITALADEADRPKPPPHETVRPKISEVLTKELLYEILTPAYLLNWPNYRRRSTQVWWALVGACEELGVIEDRQTARELPIVDLLKHRQHLQKRSYKSRRNALHISYELGILFVAIEPSAVQPAS